MNSLQVAVPSSLKVRLTGLLTEFPISDPADEKVKSEGDAESGWIGGLPCLSQVGAILYTLHSTVLQIVRVRIATGPLTEISIIRKPIEDLSNSF